MGNGSGSRDPQIEIVRIESMRTDQRDGSSPGSASCETWFSCGDLPGNSLSLCICIYINIYTHNQSI